jgi:hypothetical protein
MSPTCADSIRVMHPLFQGEEGGSIPTSALQLHVDEIGRETAVRLNRYWHSVLPEIGGTVSVGRFVYYGASFEGIYYAAAIWTRPVAANILRNGDAALELRRFAIAPDAPKNTASRMLAVMTRLVRRRFPDVVRLLSYQATDVHAGTIYRAAGWTPTVNEWRDNGWHQDWSHRRPATQNASPKVRWEKWLSASSSPPPLAPQAT